MLCYFSQRTGGGTIQKAETDAKVTRCPPRIGRKGSSSNQHAKKVCAVIQKAMTSFIQPPSPNEKGNGFVIIEQKTKVGKRWAFGLVIAGFSSNGIINVTVYLDNCQQMRHALHPFQSRSEERQQKKKTIMPAIMLHIGSR